MKLLALAISGLVLVACGKKPAPPPAEAATKAPPPVEVKPTEPTPFTVSYTYKAKEDGNPLLFVMSSDGTVEATVQMPPTRHVGKANDSLVGDIARYIANPELRALPAHNENAPLPLVEIEILDAKGVIWRRHFGGPAPDAAKLLFDRLENLQLTATRDAKPPGILQIDDTRSDGVVLSVRANGLVLVTANGRPKALGRVGNNALEDLCVAAGVLGRLRATTADKPGGDVLRHALHVERGDGTAIDMTFDGGVPLAAEWLFERLGDLEKAAKPVGAFDRITYRMPMFGKANKRKHQLLTVLPSGALTLSEAGVDGSKLGGGEAALEDLWGLLAVLEPFDALAPGGTIGKVGDLTLEVESPTGVRSVRAKSAAEAVPEARKVFAYMSRFVLQIAPPIPDDELPR